MIAAQLKALVSKAVVGRIFGMDRPGWESHAREWVPPQGWQVRLDPNENGSSVLEHDPVTGIELNIRPYYENAIDPPEALFIEMHYPPGKAPRFTADFKGDLEYEVKRGLGPEYSVSAAYATSPSSVEIELTIRKGS